MLAAQTCGLEFRSQYPHNKPSILFHIPITPVLQGLETGGSLGLGGFQHSQKNASSRFMARPCPHTHILTCVYTPLNNQQFLKHFLKKFINTNNTIFDFCSKILILITELHRLDIHPKVHLLVKNFTVRKKKVYTQQSSGKAWFKQICTPTEVSP